MKKKIIVTFAQVPFVHGGAELLVQKLIANLKTRDYDVELVQLPFRDYHTENFYDNLLSWRLLDISESDWNKVDLAIGTKFPSYGIQHPNKVTWLIHQYRQAYDLYDNKYGLSRNPEGTKIRDVIMKYDAITLGECRDIYAISKNVAKRLKQYNSIDSEPLYHPPSLVGRYYNSEPKDYILSVGRITKLKRLDLLIQALAFCDKNINAVIAGTGPDRENLEKLASEIGVSERVHFFGLVSDEDLLRIYAEARMVFFCPVDEDYGYITLEAFLSSKPVITCFDSGGTLEFVENDVNGFVCEPDVQHIAEKINKVWNKKETLIQMGHDGLLRVKDIGWDNVIDKLTETIR